MNRITPTFSRPFDEALIRLELIDEMIREDGWGTLDDCVRDAPQALKIFERHATAALRVFRRLEEREQHIRPSDI